MEKLNKALGIAKHISKQAELINGILWANNENLYFAFVTGLDITARIDVASAQNALKLSNEKHALIKHDDILKIKDDLLTVSVNCSAQVENINLNIITEVTLPAEIMQIVSMFAPIAKNNGPSLSCQELRFDQSNVIGTNAIILLQYYYTNMIPQEFYLSREAIVLMSKIKDIPVKFGYNDEAYVIAYENFRIGFKFIHGERKPLEYMLNCNTWKPIDGIQSTLETILKFKDKELYLGNRELSGKRASIKINEVFKPMIVRSEELKYLKYATHYNDDDHLKFYGNRIRGVIAESKVVKCI